MPGVVGPWRPSGLRFRLPTSPQLPADLAEVLQGGIEASPEEHLDRVPHKPADGAEHLTRCAQDAHRSSSKKSLRVAAEVPHPTVPYIGATPTVTSCSTRSPMSVAAIRSATSWASASMFLASRSGSLWRSMRATRSCVGSLHGWSSSTRTPKSPGFIWRLETL